jgi:hypothetical protein
MAVEGTAAAPSPTDVARRRLFRVAGIAGLAAVVLIFVAVLVGTPKEPTFNSAATEVLSYYRSPNTPGGRFPVFRPDRRVDCLRLVRRRADHPVASR